MVRSRENFGKDVIGPILGEFCLQLWSFGSMLDCPDDAAMLFCARGGLRLMLAYEHFLAGSGLSAPTTAMPLMVSRVVAIQPVLVTAAQTSVLSPSAASTLCYEFSNHSLADVLRAISGCDVSGLRGVTDKFTPERLVRFLSAPGGTEALNSISKQDSLFRRHLATALGGRRHAILVDTGLFGTTLQLLRDGIPDINFSCALVARSNYRGPRHAAHHSGKVIGLAVDIRSYSPLQRRSAILRYWHLIESTLEPLLPSVRTFKDLDGVPVSNLEINGWRDKIEAEAGSIFAGAMAYLKSLSHGDPSRVIVDADLAWKKLYRAVVWPDAVDANVLDVGARDKNFGVDATAVARPWNGPFHALRGKTIWREGEIARSNTPLRLVLLATIEAAYLARSASQTILGSYAMFAKSRSRTHVTEANDVGQTLHDR